MRTEFLSLVLCALLCACSSGVSQDSGSVPSATAACDTTSCLPCDTASCLPCDATLRTFSVSNGRDLFYSDSLNACDLYRTYPEPVNVTYTPAPKGYRPVYISSYARHGSRKLIGTGQSSTVRKVMEAADEAGCLTPLGTEIYSKIIAMDDDLHVSDADLTAKGDAQHRGIAQRMYRNYPDVFKAKGTPVRLYSTFSQRTMMSMFAENAALIELNPSIVSTRRASRALTYLVRIPESPRTDRKPATDDFIRDYFNSKPLLGRIFTDGAPAIPDTSYFVRSLYGCASIAPGLDLDDVEFLWDLFTHDELFILQQSQNYYFYLRNSNSPMLGDLILPAMSPLLQDFVDKADEALAEDIPGADLRFGHDSYLICLSALLGVNGYVKQEDDPLKVIDTFQDFIVAPMAGNLQWVFYRNRSGDVIVKILQNEVEASLPISTDIAPYYRWTDLRDYCLSLIDPDCLNPGPDPMRR